MTSLKTLVQDNSACSLPFVHVEANLQMNEIKPCCKITAPAAAASNEFKVTWFNNRFTELRTSMENSIPLRECKACNVPKEAFSYKNWKNQLYETIGILENVDTSSPQLPKVFNFSLSNICNLACRMCGPISSSRLESFAGKSEILAAAFGDYKFIPSYDLSKFSGSFKNTELVTIAGGEPMIDKLALELVRMLKVEAKKLRAINFSTNLTRVNEAFLDAITDLGVISSISISFDGPKTIHEYIRYGCSWDVMMDNIAKIKQLYPHFKYYANISINALNAGYMPELIVELNNIQERLGIEFKQIMASPVLQDHMHAKVLPPSVKQLYLQKFELFDKSNIKTQGAELLIPTAKNLMSEIGSTSKFKEYIEEFDRLVNTNYKEVYPELNL